MNQLFAVYDNAHSNKSIGMNSCNDNHCYLRYAPSTPPCFVTCMHASLRKTLRTKLIAASEQPSKLWTKETRNPLLLVKPGFSVLNHRIPLSCHCLDSILSSPFPRCRFVPRTIGLVYMGYLRYQRIIRIRVCEHGADGEKH